MSMQDPIADLFTRVRNALSARKTQVDIPASNLKVEIAKLLETEGFINGYAVSEEGAHRTLSIDLKYFEGAPAIRTLKRVSRPGLRIYKSHAELPRVMDGLGMAIVSTSKGVMSDKAARAAGLGGEIFGTVE